MKSQSIILTLAIIGILIVSGCNVQSPTGSTVIDTVEEPAKTTKFTVPDEEEPQPPVKEEETCEEKVKDLEEDINTLYYKIGKVLGKKQKLAIELHFKKDNLLYKEDVEELIQQITELSDEQREMKGDLESTEAALKILEGKC